MNPGKPDFPALRTAHRLLLTNLTGLLAGIVQPGEIIPGVPSDISPATPEYLQGNGSISLADDTELTRQRVQIYAAASRTADLHHAGEAEAAKASWVQFVSLDNDFHMLLEKLETRFGSPMISEDADATHDRTSDPGTAMPGKAGTEVEFPANHIISDKHLFREMMAASPIALWMTDEFGQLAYMSPAWDSWTEQDSTPVSGNHWIERSHPGDKEKVWTLYKEAFSNQQSFEVEFRMKIRTGDTHFFHATGKPVFSDKSIFKGFSGSITDITGQKRGQDTILTHLTSERQVLHDFFMQAPAMFCILKGPNHVVELTNPGYKQLIGNREVTGMTIREALPELKNQGFFELLDRVYSTRETYIGTETPVSLQQNQGTELRFLNFIYQPIINQLDETEGILVFAHDITEQVLDRRKTEGSEERFRKLIEEAPIPMCLYTGPDMKIEIANEALLSLWGRDKSIIGLTLLQALPELAGQPFPQLLESVFQTGQPFSTTEAATLVARQGTLETVYFDLWYNPVRHPAGEVYGVLATGVDVSDKVRAQRSIEESENKFRNMVQYAPIAIGLTKGSDHIFESINEPMLRLIRQTENIVGKKVLDILPMLPSQGILDILDKVYTTGKPFYGNEVPVRIEAHSDINYFNLSYTPLFENTEVVGIIHVALDVTEQVISRRKVEESEQQMRSLVESAPFPIGVYHGREMRIQLANQSILDAWGKGDVVGKLYSEVLPELDNQDIYPQLDGVFMTGVPFHAKNQRVDLVVDGRLQPFYFNYSFTPLRHAGGSVYGVMNTAADVTDLNVAMQKIEDSELRWRRLTNVVPAFIFTASPEGSISFVSDKFLEFTGLQFEDAIGESYFNTLHPGDRPSNRSKWQRSMQTQQVFENEVRWKHRDGEYRWVVVRAEPVKDYEGNIITWIGSGMDISELKRTQQELVESESRFRLMADAMPQLIWTSTPEGQFNYFNQAAYDYTGLTHDLLQQDGWLSIVDAEEAVENRRHWLEAVKTGNDFIYQHRFRSKDGEYRWQLSRAVPQRDAAGNIQLWIGTSTDIHAQKTFSQQLEQMVQERTQELLEVNYDLERSNQELQQFAYIASHDLQEPLRKIITFSNRLTDQQDLPPGSAVYLDKINVSARRMSQLIHDLLDFSSTTRNSTSFERTNLGNLLYELLTDFELDIQNKHALVEIGDLPILMAMPMQMTQLFHNLLSNALKFTRPGIPPLITISARRVAGDSIVNQVSADRNTDYWEIIFKDNGIGFEQKFSEQIFAIFQRLHGKATFEGTGIGLALCRRIVDNHNGFIIAQSESNAGASFHIFLPAGDSK